MQILEEYSILNLHIFFELQRAILLFCFDYHSERCLNYCFETVFLFGLTYFDGAGILCPWGVQDGSLGDCDPKVNCTINLMLSMSRSVRAALAALSPVPLADTARSSKFGWVCIHWIWSGTQSKD